MFGRFKAKKPIEKPDEIARETAQTTQPAGVDQTTSTLADESTIQTTKKGWFAGLRDGLKRSRDKLGDGIATLMLGKKVVDETLLEDIEALLLSADIGVDASRSIIDDLTQALKRKQLNDANALMAQLNQALLKILAPCEKPLVIDTEKKPFVLLMVGMNGAGKTTSIGKIAKRLQAEGKKVMLAAGDTFRAAAVEQLQIWGERNQIPVMSQAHGADSAAVIFDALSAASARGIDVLIADTAGRLHTQGHLMQELAKILRVIKKIDPTAPHEVMLVLDASIGQNALRQAEAFKQVVNVSGITLTKLDGTAKGGIIFAIAKQLALPIRYVGVGEGIDDLKTFDAKSFIKALLT